MDLKKLSEASDYEVMDAIGDKEGLLAEDYLSTDRRRQVARDLNHLIFEVDFRTKNGITVD